MLGLPLANIMHNKLRSAMCAGAVGIGIAMLTVDRDGSHFCAACQMDVPIQEVSLALAGEKLVQCRSCNRILCVEALPAHEARGTKQ